MLLSGELGRLVALNFWAYTGWMLQPRMPQEVDESLGGGIVWRQAPHQIEAARWLGGGLVRSVRAMTGRWRPERPMGSGYYAAFLEFEDGTPANLVYNANGYFDTAALVEWGEDRGMEGRIVRRQALLSGALDEAKGKEAARFGALVEGKEGPQIPWEQRTGGEGGGPRVNMPGNQGVFVVSCERGDLRASPDGLYVYDDEGKREVPVTRVEGAGMAFLESEPMELYQAVRNNQPMLHDGRWGMATSEVQWAIIESARRREEIGLKHQVPVPLGF
jgi:phthalate 4,5-cis-dihydrodiol dehydrogenase